MHLPGTRHFSHQPVLLLGEEPMCRNSPGGLHRPRGPAHVRARGPYVCIKVGHAWGHTCACKGVMCVCEKVGHACVFKGAICVHARAPDMLRAGAPDVCILGCFPCACGPCRPPGPELRVRGGGCLSAPLPHGHLPRHSRQRGRNMKAETINSFLPCSDNGPLFRLINPHVAFGRQFGSDSDKPPEGSANLHSIHHPVKTPQSCGRAGAAHSMGGTLGKGPARTKPKRANWRQLCSPLTLSLSCGLH